MSLTEQTLTRNITQGRGRFGGSYFQACWAWFIQLYTWVLELWQELEENGRKIGAGKKKKTGESRWRGSNWMPANSHAFIPPNHPMRYLLHSLERYNNNNTFYVPDTVSRTSHAPYIFPRGFFFLTNIMSLCYYVLLFYILYLFHTILLFSFYRWRNKLLEILNQHKSKLPKSTELETNSLNSKPSSTPNSST